MELREKVAQSAHPARRVPVPGRRRQNPLRGQSAIRCAAASVRISWNRSWQDAKTGSLVREIADVDYIVVDNQKEALALENNLIKQHKPKFNVLLRDDKTYPYIRTPRLRNIRASTSRAG